MANTLITKNDSRGTDILLDLIGKQRQDAAWSGSKHSAFLTQRRALDEETTALIVMAMLRTYTAEDQVKTATAYLYGQLPYTTERPTLLYRALAKYERRQVGDFEGGELIFLVNGTQVYSKKIEKLTNRPILIKGLEKYIKGETARLEFWFEQANTAIPFELNINYPVEENKEEILSISSKLDSSSLRVGETLHLSISLSNKSKETLPLTRTKVPLPGGSMVQDWQLDALVEQGTIDAYELDEGCLLLYKRWFPRESTVEVNLDMKAIIPGFYQLVGFEQEKLVIARVEE